MEMGIYSLGKKASGSGVIGVHATSRYRLQGMMRCTLKRHPRQGKCPEGCRLDRIVVQDSMRTCTPFKIYSTVEGVVGSIFKHVTSNGLFEIVFIFITSTVKPFTYKSDLPQDLPKQSPERCQGRGRLTVAFAYTDNAHKCKAYPQVVGYSKLEIQGYGSIKKKKNL